MRTITLEEHFVTNEFIKATGSYGAGTTAGVAVLRDKLLDIGAGRIAAMDAARIDTQVLSLAAIGRENLSNTDEPAILRGVHDELAAAMKAHPDRFAGLATAGLLQPSEAVKEIERCVQELGFKGVIVVAMGVPLYLHPAPPPKAVADVYYSGLPHEVGHLLSIAGWGWHAETGLHVLRLITSGVMDRLPELRIIIGHMGEGLPYALARSSGVLSHAAKLQRSVADTFKEQCHVTTSGYFTRPPFECAREVFGFEHMMYSVDYPFSSNERGVEFLQQLELSGDEMAAFCGGHAAALLKM